MNKILILAGALLLSITGLAQAELASDAVTVKSPHIKAVRINQDQTQVFMDLDNTDQATHTLIAATSPVSKQTQLHKTITTNGERSMQQVNRIAIRSHADRDLHQGGFHVMLIGLKDQLKAGEIIPITLVFEDGSDLLIKAKVDNQTA